MMNPFNRPSELERYLEKQEIYKCKPCRGTGYLAINGTEHTGPDGQIDYEIEKCKDCNGKGSTK